MAHSTLAVLAHPDFPQVLRAAIDRAVDRIIPSLGYCSYESAEPRWGACDGLPCKQKAVIHHLELQRDLCAKHFLEANRG